MIPGKERKKEEGKKEERKEGRKEGRKEERKEGRKEGREGRMKTPGQFGFCYCKIVLSLHDVFWFEGSNELTLLSVSENEKSLI